MQQHERTWGLVLAGGNGSRLESLTRDGQGTVVPKQFCSFRGGSSLLRASIERLGRVIDRERIVVVVAAAHRRWWEPQIADLDPENVIVQPSDRGTACGIMLPLLHIGSLDPMARIVVTPSDHFIDDEGIYASSIRKAISHVDSRPFLLVVLGIEPEYPADDFGWIVGATAGEDGLQVVSSFVEKPEFERACRLMESGALWNSFTFVASVEGLLARFKRTLPWLANRFRDAFAFESWPHRNQVLLRLYDKLPSVDFSGDLLQRSGGRFHVLRVSPCGWTDLGTPMRVAECVRRWGCPVGPTCTVANGHTDLLHAPIDLARAVAEPAEGLPSTGG